MSDRRSGSLGFAACYRRDARNPALERAKGFGVKVEAFLMKEGWMVGGWQSLLCI